MSKKWDPHKEEILRLYIVENLTVDQVMKYMLQTHGFNQKKPHYEYRLKLWGARKNVKKEVLEYISHQDRKRGPSQDLNSGAYVVDGMLLSESRVKRARYRHNLDLSLARKYSRVPSPKLPTGHNIHRSIPPASETAVDWPRSLPWLRFEERFRIVMPQSSTFIQLLARATNSCRLFSGMNIDNSFDLARAIYAASYETQFHATNLTRMLPRIPNGSNTSSGNTDLLNPEDVATKILKAFLFQVSNKLYDRYNDELRKDLLSLFQELDKTNPMVLSRFIDSHDPTSEAIIETLHEAAVEHGATALVFRLLEAGRDVNARLSIQWPYYNTIIRGGAYLALNNTLTPMTALQYAASTRNIEFADALIKAGAKTDFGQPTPLQILCLSSDVGQEVALLFAHLLISNGAEVNTPSNDWACPLEGAVLCRNRSLVDFLLSRGATDVARFGDVEESIDHLSYFKYDKDRFSLWWPDDYDTWAPTSALQLAIMTEEHSIAKVLISSITAQRDMRNELLEHSYLADQVLVLEHALITACVAQDHDFAQMVLEKFDSRLQVKDDLIIAVFFATAKDLDCRIAQLLVEHTAIRGNLSRSYFLIFQRASFFENINLIILLHSNGFDINCGASYRIDDPGAEDGWKSPLRDAIDTGCRKVIETLLDLGADTSEIDVKTASQSRSSNLITRVLSQCSNIDLSRDGQSALDPAILCGAGLPVIHKLINAGATIQGHELIDAVRSNDQEVVDFLLPVCSILATNSKSETVLEAACCTGNLDMAQRYFSCGGIYGSRALLLAVSRAVKIHDYRFIEHITANRPPGPIDAHEATALALSIRMGDTKVMDALLHDDFQPSTAFSTYHAYEYFQGNPKDAVETRVNPFDYEDLSLEIQEIVGKRKMYYSEHVALSPLLVAAAMAQEHIVRKLLAHGYLPDPCLFDMPCKSLFIEKKIRDMIMAAYTSQISKVADKDWQQGMLWVALRRGLNPEIIQQHFTKLPSLDFEYNYTIPGVSCVPKKASPLENAVRSGSYNNVRAVLEAGATADARKWPPAAEALQSAVSKGCLDIVSLLLEHGAYINKDPHGAFYDALEQEDLTLTLFLLDHGLDINGSLAFPVHYVSYTCLESAAVKGSVDMVEMLLSRGVNIQGRARLHFVKAVVLAIQECNYTLAKFLKERGGWSDDDDEVAKLPQVRDSNFRLCCARRLYGDPTLEGCRSCEYVQVTAPVSDFSDEEGGEDGEDGEEVEEVEDDDDDDDATICPRSYEVADEQFLLGEVNNSTGDMSASHIEPELNYDEQTNGIPEWPHVAYGQQDSGFDIPMLGTESGFSYHQQINGMYQLPLIPYGQQSMELNAPMLDIAYEFDYLQQTNGMLESSSSPYDQHASVLDASRLGVESGVSYSEQTNEMNEWPFNLSGHQDGEPGMMIMNGFVLEDSMIQ